MTDKIEVEVTDVDIKKGVSGDAAFCPIARAIRRQFPKKEIVVDCKTFSIGKDEYRFPAHVTHFIDRFDQNEEVAPIRFLAVKTGIFTNW